MKQPHVRGGSIVSGRRVAASSGAAALLLISTSSLPGRQADPAASRPAAPPQAFSEVRVSEFMSVDLVVQNDDIRNVLQKLAVQARRNIVPSPNVQGPVNCTVYSAPFYDAIDALLNANGYGYIERGEFIYVYTAAEMNLVRADAQRRQTRTITLNYLRAEDAKRFAKGLLSEKGWIEATEDRGSGGAAASSAPSGPGTSGSSPRSASGGMSSSGSIYSPHTDEYPLLNAIVVHDFPENLAEIEELLKSLDTRPAQVLIEATIVQATLNEQNAFGIDFALLSEVQFTEFLGFPSVFDPLGFTRSNREPVDPAEASTRRDQTGFIASTPGATGTGPASVRAGIIAGDVGIFLRALDQVTDVTLLSNPKVLTLNRQRARVLVGTRVGYLETTTVENQVNQTIQFLDTGIELDMRPFILDNNMVRIELAPKVSQATFRVIQGPGGAQQQIPDENLQTVNTDVHVPQGYTAVLGGLFREDTMRSRSQVPILGDIPIVGAAFRGHDDTTSRAEIMFMIKPTVMKDKVVIAQGERAQAWERAVHVGSREGLLPWSRDRQSARLNLDAERRAAEGDLSGAMWSVRRSLELHPVQPDAIMLREALAMKPTAWPRRSLLERIIDAEAGFVEPEAIPAESTPGEAPAESPAEAPPESNDDTDPTHDQPSEPEE